MQYDRQCRRQCRGGSTGRQRSGASNTACDHWLKTRKCSHVAPAASCTSHARPFALIIDASTPFSYLSNYPY